MEEAVHLMWKHFHDNHNNTFKSLKGSPDFIDVTLVCEDGKKIGVHKAILAASSPLFHSLLNGNKNDNEMMYLTGVKSEDVSSVVDFMYCGETRVHRANVDTFLAITNDLKLEGLFGKTNSNDDEEIYTITVPVEENAKEMQIHTSQMTQNIKHVSEKAQDTDFVRRTDLIPINERPGGMKRENGNKKEKNGKRESEVQKEKEQEKNKENERENKKEREQDHKKERKNKENKLASLEATLVRNYDPPTRSLTGVRCRATSIAKNYIQSFIAPHLLILVSFSADIFSQLSTNLISRDKNLISQEKVSII